MKNRAIKFLVGGLFCLGLIWGLAQIKFVRTYLNDYGIKSTEELCGTRSLSPVHEAFICNIAQEMGITEKIIIRRMSAQIMQVLGYHNAFIVFPHLWQIIPISDQPMMFVSEGMFEDLSPIEQRFLIGHELIHARDRHVKYLDITYLLIIIILLSLSFGLIFYLNHCQVRQNILFLLAGVLLFISIFGPYLGVMAYRRHIEEVADTDSLKLLNSYDGFLALNARWQKEFCLPKHNNTFFGLLADHPSCHEREQLCLKLQNQAKNNQN